MQVRNNYMKKSLVQFITEEYSIAQAREHLERTGFRCVPILDKTKTKFLGNVYEIDTYKYKGSLADSVLQIADDKDAVVYEDESFYRVFFTIKKLPFLAVLNTNQEFVGILTHAAVMSVAEDAFAISSKGHSITIAVYDFDNTLKTLTKIVSKHSSIQSLITLHSSKFVRQIVFTVPETIEEKALANLRKDLTEANFKIVHEDQLLTNS
ncbi:cyclic di-AMP binding protein CbpA [Caldibacillus lycopersici]|uniref:Cyclic di-AMP binding protein CbpA n=1 Tax=Perspicuibacillus lycopersici TaxID=1325689 RepID=A0AAE3IUN9_9BACI|nr:cyclic di-AMP binding protein CbpA [Perspicuibacillus lycopersici]MCU9612390.1 cyclic di-AMP binding protein CbpA [Perspicuibacillus lycopersici]